MDHALNLQVVDEEIESAIAPLDGATAITTDDEYVETVEYLRDYAKPALRRIEEEFAKIEKPFKEALDNLREVRRGYVDRVKAVIAGREGAAAAYKKQIDTARKAAEAAALKLAQEEAEAKRAAEVEAAIEAGDEQAAEVLLSAPVEADVETLCAIMPAAVAVPKIEGVQNRTTWRGEVTGKLLFLVWCALDWSNRAKYLKVNDAEVNVLARQTEGKATVPGVKWIEKTSIATRR